MFSLRILTRLYSAPCGELLLGSVEGRLCLCDWLVERHHNRVKARLQRALHAPSIEGDSPVLQRAAAELDAYFAGGAPSFTTPLFFPGTAFQEKVWQLLRGIRPGETLSYGDVARQLGMPTAARAVANAVGANALSVFIPCHRVIASGGRLGGYGGGPAAKRFLLRHEGALPPRAEAVPHPEFICFSAKSVDGVTQPR